MPRLTIDQCEIEVPEGATILDAARALGVDIPTLCFLKGLAPATSCMICLVKIEGPDRLVPACATRVEDGMRVENESEAIRDLRRVGLELLLSDHLGDCTAPCNCTCPADMNVPLMLSQVQAGDMRAAIATVKKDIALPAVLGRVCPDLCERTCRRSQLDDPVAVCLVKRRVADEDLARESPYLPPCRPASGRSVAIVGAGPAGVTAAFHLRQAGHACTVFDQAEKPGGKLRHQFSEEELPRHVLDAEIAVIEKLGVRFELGQRIDSAAALEALCRRFDAVLVATGRPAEPATDYLGLPAAGGRVQIDARTHATPRPGVFAAGDAVQPTALVVRNVASGKSAALCIDQFLSSGEVMGPARPFAVRIGRVDDEELARLGAGAAGVLRASPSPEAAGGLTSEAARAEAERCLHCECSQRDHCKLREYAARYGARANRYPGPRRSLERHFRHGEIVFEPGKCILCGLCIQITTEAREPLGLSFVGRGFDMRIGVPFDRSMDEALTTTAARCADACPTGAIALRAGRSCCPGSMAGAPGPPGRLAGS